MSETAKRSGRINWTNLMTVGSACVLVGAMMLVLGFSTGWALAGILGLGDIGEWILGVIFFGIALAGTVAFWRSATRAEPIIDR